MSQINLKSISGITSITTPAGADNQLTLHNNNTTEAVKLDVAGNLHFHNHLNITGISTASNFKTGTSNLHNTGLNVQDLDVDGHTNLDNVSIAGFTTITGTGQNGQFNVERASGAGLHIQAQSALGVFGTTSNHNLRIIANGNERMMFLTNGNIGINESSPDTKLHVRNDNSAAVKIGGEGGSPYYMEIGQLTTSSSPGFNATGSGAAMLFRMNGSEKFRIGPSGQFGLSGTNYGTSGQVLTSQGNSATPTWTTVSGTTINNNANDRIITGSGTANTLEGESTVTFNGSQFRINAGSGCSLQVDGLESYIQVAGVRLWNGENARAHCMGVGANTLSSSSLSGDDITAVGHNAYANGTSGEDNTVVGSHAMDAVVTGNHNCAFGHASLTTLTSGYNNSCYGRTSGFFLLNGHNNTFLGYDCGYNTTSGSYNIFGGSGAGKFETTSNDNVAFGYHCFGGERSGGNSNSCNKNVVVGHQAMAQQRIANGDGENVCLGYRAMYNTQTAAWRNVVIGFEAGYNNQASKTTFVGTYAGKGYQSGGNTMCLGYNAGTASSPSGNLTNQQDTVVLGDNNISQFYCSDTSISSSDARDKTDITEWTHGLSFINQLKPVTYRWDKRTWYGTDEEPMGTPDGSKKRARLHLGFLAQDALEVEKSFGYASKKDDMLAVNLNEDESAYGMKYERLVVPLTKAVQELSAEVDKLKAEIAALKSS